MWKRRAFAQLAKCAEAQALRKHSLRLDQRQPLMRWKARHSRNRRATSPIGSTPSLSEEAPPAYSDDLLTENIAKWQPLIDSNRTSPEHLIATISSKYTLSPAQIEKITNLKALDGDAA